MARRGQLKGSSGAPAGSRGLPRTAAAQAFGSPSRYHLAVIVLIYFLPLVVMFFAYSVIGFTLWRCAVPGYHAHGANTHYLLAKKKVGAGAGRGGPGRAQGSPSRGRRGAQDPLVTCRGPKSLARA